MKKHTKVYFKGMNIHPSDWVACEWAGSGWYGTANDINHIIPRGMGGSKTKDYIENLVAMCRHCHLEFEAKRIGKEELREKHLKNIP